MCPVSAGSLGFSFFVGVMRLGVWSAERPWWAMDATLVNRTMPGWFVLRHVSLLDAEAWIGSLQQAKSVYRRCWSLLTPLQLHL